MTSHAIGFVGKDHGKWGIEREYDNALMGVPGRKFITFEPMLISAALEENIIFINDTFECKAD